MIDLSPLPAALVRGTLLGCVALVWVILLVRVIGTRALSKMTAFDFLVTLAAASLIATASAATTWTAFAQAMAAITTLLCVQFLLALARRYGAFRRLIENEPRLLMRNGRFLDHAMRNARVSRADIIAKLREANITSDSATAVVLETTGDIAVVTVPASDNHLLQGVRNEGDQ